MRHHFFQIFPDFSSWRSDSAANMRDDTWPSSACREIPATAREVAKSIASRPERLKGDRAQANNRLRLDHRKLPEKKRRARRHLILFRRAIFRRPALHHVADVNVFALQSHGLDHLRQQFSRAAHERQAECLRRAPALRRRIQARARGFPRRKQSCCAARAAGTACNRRCLRESFERIVFDALGSLEKRRRDSMTRQTALAARGADSLQRSRASAITARRNVPPAR